eukprot:364388-Chlamydomonas_euryale.AAC.2
MVKGSLLPSSQSQAVWSSVEQSLLALRPPSSVGSFNQPLKQHLVEKDPLPPLAAWLTPQAIGADCHPHTRAALKNVEPPHAASPPVACPRVREPWCAKRV